MMRATFLVLFSLFATLAYSADTIDLSLPPHPKPSVKPSRNPSHGGGARDLLMRKTPIDPVVDDATREGQLRPDAQNQQLLNQDGRVSSPVLGPNPNNKENMNIR